MLLAPFFSSLYLIFIGSLGAVTFFAIAIHFERLQK